MSIELLKENLSIIQNLGDNPNSDNNLSAEELKMKFDEAAKIIQVYLNTVVVPYINELDAAFTDSLDPTLTSAIKAAQAKAVGDAIHRYRGTYEGNIDDTKLNGVYFITSAKCTGTFPEIKYTYFFFDATERYQKLIGYTDTGIGVIEERYYTNSKWYPWKKTDAINSVPTARKINEKELTSDITLSASDVGARPNTWMPTASDVGAAPAGFGLGTAASKSIDSVKNINAEGWWFTKGDTPDGGNWFCIPRMVNSGNDMVVDAWSFNGLYNAKINKSTSKGWGEWEWVNPPLSLNVEYRTTERMDGKPVYCKRVLFGDGPNNTYKSVNHNIANIAQVVEWHAYNYNSGTNIEQGSGVTAITVNRETMNISSNENIAAWYIYFIIKYTKTTD